MVSRREVMLSELMRDMPMSIDSNVLPDDRTLVRNVIACVCTLKHQKMIHTIEVERVKNGYHLLARITDGEDFDFDTVDLEVINSVSPLRITTSSIERRAGKIHLRIRILDSSQPVNITETSVTHIRKRCRLSRM
jgi:hypothetical protein